MRTKYECETRSCSLHHHSITSNKTWKAIHSWNLLFSCLLIVWVSLASDERVRPRGAGIDTCLWQTRGQILINTNRIQLKINVPRSLLPTRDVHLTTMITCIPLPPLSPRPKGHIRCFVAKSSLASAGLSRDLLSNTHTLSPRSHIHTNRQTHTHSCQRVVCEMGRVSLRRLGCN